MRLLRIVLWAIVVLAPEAARPQSALADENSRRMQEIGAVEQAIGAGDLTQAKKLLGRLGPEVRQTSRALLLQAAILHHEGDLPKSLEVALASLEKDPCNADAHKLFGLNTARLGRPDLAEPYFEQAVELAPDDPRAHYYFGVNLIDLRKPEEAKRRLLRALELDPASIDAKCALGLAYELTSDFAGAARIYEEAIAMREATGEKTAIPYLYPGRLLIAEEEWKQAAEVLRRAVAVDPKGADGWYEYGRALARIGDPAEALEALDTAARLAPADPQPHYIRMQVLKRLGRDAEAREAAATFERLRAERDSSRPLHPR